MITEGEKKKVIEDLGKWLLMYGMHLWKNYKEKSHQRISKYGIGHYIRKFLGAIKLSEFIYICNYGINRSSNNRSGIADAHIHPLLYWTFVRIARG